MFSLFINVFCIVKHTFYQFLCEVFYSIFEETSNTDILTIDM